MLSICARCDHAGADVRIKSNGRSTTSCYHARCLDFHPFLRQKEGPQPQVEFEIIPLSFDEIDNALRLSSTSSSRGGGSGGESNGGGAGNCGGMKRGISELTFACDSDRPDSPNGQQLLWSYDPLSPRTGKWTEEEIAFRDSLVPHFVEGSLPLPTGLKLIDFLSCVLKSKPSRLTKKMKHAKLSTRHFGLVTGYIQDYDRAREVSKLEVSFINSIVDPVERSEVQFHMAREWRDHVAERFTALRIPFDAEEWLKTVDIMDRRVTLAKSRNRMVKRRSLMGKAMEMDTSNPAPGVFIISTGDSHAQDHVGYDLLANALETYDHDDEDLTELWSSIYDVANTEAGEGSSVCSGGKNLSPNNNDSDSPEGRPSSQATTTAKGGGIRISITTPPSNHRPRRLLPI